MSAAGVVALLGAGAGLLAAHDLVAVARSLQVRRGSSHRNRLPQVLPVPARVQLALSRAGVEDHQRALAVWLAVVAGAGLLAAVATGGRILLAAALAGPPVAVHLARGRLDRRRTAQLPDALDAVGAGLRGGLGLAGAVEGAASVGPPLGPELAGIGAEVRAGRPLADAVARWQRASGDPATSLAAAALGVAATVGGPGARAVDGAAASLRDRLAAEAEADALATQAKASAAVLTVAPIGFAVLLTSLDPTAARFLLGTPVGWACITAGLALDAAGAAWMAALVRRAR
jgi:tight adherence protein B